MGIFFFPIKEKNDPVTGRKILKRTNSVYLNS